MLHAVRVLHRLVVLLDQSPADRPAVRWITPHAWGSGRGPFVTPGHEPGERFEGWADEVARDVARGAGSGSFGNYVSHPQSIGFRAPFGSDADELRAVDRAQEFVRAALGGPAPGQRHVVRVAPAFVPPPDLAPHASGKGVAYTPFCRGLVEGLVDLLADEEAALGGNYPRLRAALEGLFETATLRRGWTGKDRDARRVGLLNRLKPAYRDPLDLSDPAGLWVVAVSSDLGPLLYRANQGRLWDDDREERGLLLAVPMQRLVARVGLARAIRTEDPAEAFAWAEGRLREGLRAHLPAADAVGGVGAFLRGRSPG